MYYNLYFSLLLVSIELFQIILCPSCTLPHPKSSSQLFASSPRCSTSVKGFRIICSRTAKLESFSFRQPTPLFHEHMTFFSIGVVISQSTGSGKQLLYLLYLVNYYTPIDRPGKPFGFWKLFIFSLNIRSSSSLILQNIRYY